MSKNWKVLGKNTVMITIPYSFQVSLGSVNRGDGYELIFYMILWI